MGSDEENLISVLSGAHIERLLTPAEALAIQGKLWDLLANRAESYTMGGSSSVRIETAQELLKSAGFVLRHGIYAAGGDHGLDGDIGPEAAKARLLNGDYGALFRAGLRALETQVQEGRALLDSVLATATVVDNGAYRETLNELGLFFKRYHYHHFAHEIPCMLDYPLAQPVDEALLGIDYINEYLRRLHIENDLCRRFDAAAVRGLLQSVSPAYKEDLLSIYETVTANALGLVLLGGDVPALDVTDRDRGRLLTLFRSWPDAAVAGKLTSAAAELCGILDIGEAAAIEYLTQTAEALYARLRPMVPLGRLEHIFPPLYREPEEDGPAVTYIDGVLMDDEKLRALIDALTSCASVSDKIALARRNIFSLRDWGEVLDVCFWEVECKALYDALSDAELAQLRLFAARRRRRYPEWRSETGWEIRLDSYRRKQN